MNEINIIKLKLLQVLPKIITDDVTSLGIGLVVKQIDDTSLKSGENSSTGEVDGHSSEIHPYLL